MRKHSKPARGRKWFDSGHASLCLLGEYLRRSGFFRPLEEMLHRHCKQLCSIFPRVGIEHRAPFTN